MTNPEIPEEAVEDAAKAMFALSEKDAAYPCKWEDNYATKGKWRGRARAALAAALPHLRVQETPGRYRLAWMSAHRRAGQNLRAALFIARHSESQQLIHDAIAAPLAERAARQSVALTGPGAQFVTGTTLNASDAPHPRPVVDREAVLEALAKQFIAGDGLEYGGDWENPQHRAEYLRIAQPFAAAILALLPTEEGEGS